MEKLKLGVLGGMGPEATSLFFNKIVKNTIATKDQEHLNIVILNHSTIPDRTEVILNKEKHLFLDAIKEDLRLFEKAKVSHIAIPCNTSHFFIHEIQKLTSIKIINMIDETVEELVKRNGENKKIAILATDGTIKTKIYETSCLKNGLIPYTPDKEIQKTIMDTIYNIKKGCIVCPTILEDIIYTMIHNYNCTSVILGCTELSTIPIKHEFRQLTIDPLEVLVHKSIIYSKGESKLKTKFLNRL